MKPLPKYFKTSFRGQATLLAILIASAVAVVTAVGVASRQNSSFRRTTYTAQTDQSFSCANSGVDSTLLCITEQEKANVTDISTIISTCKKSSPQSVSGGNCSYTTEISNLTNNYTVNPITAGQVQQIITNGVENIILKWKDADADAQKPALEVTYAYFTGTNYEMKKYAFTCGNSVPTGASVSGFDDKTPDGSGECTTGAISLTATSPESLVRVKPLFSSASVNINLSSDTNSQGYLIKSQGKAGNSIRNIEVLRMNPQLPALFDYVLYSEEGDIKK